MEENLKTKLNKGKDEVCSSVTSVARVHVCMTVTYRVLEMLQELKKQSHVAESRETDKSERCG